MESFFQKLFHLANSYLGCNEAMLWHHLSVDRHQDLLILHHDFFLMHTPHVCPCKLKESVPNFLCRVTS